MVSVRMLQITLVELLMVTTLLFLSDIDECQRGTDNCHYDAMCNDTDGSFTCTCLSGYEGDGIDCQSEWCKIYVYLTIVRRIISIFHGSDVDECENETHNCDQNATCTDTDGSFSCTCNDGYVGDGVNCTSK